MNSQTNKKLIKAYGKLLKKDDEKIKVKSLCEKADIARATFYLYYKDIDDFTEKLKSHIINRFFEQALVILSCSEDAFADAVKKENLLLSDDELLVLNNFISGTNYIDFALAANSIYRSYPIEIISEELYVQNKLYFDFFAHGFLPMLIFGLIDYDEKKFRSEMKHCRIYFKFLCKIASNNEPS